MSFQTAQCKPLSFRPTNLSSDKEWYERIGNAILHFKPEVALLLLPHHHEESDDFVEIDFMLSADAQRQSKGQTTLRQTVHALCKRVESTTVRAKLLQLDTELKRLGFPVSYWD